jgi:hypothetical protein
LQRLSDEVIGRDPGTFQLYGGGGGGNYSVVTTTRDISIKDYRKELDDWFTKFKENK